MEAILELAMGFSKSQILYAVTRLNIPELLEDGPKSYQEITEALKGNEDRIERLLRAAGSIGILARDPETLKYSLNNISSQLLDKQGAPSMKYGVLCICEPLVQSSWSKLRECMFTTTDAVQLVHGVPLFEYLAKNPESQENFSKGMTAFAAAMDIGKSICAIYKFEDAKTFVDVGGNQGTVAADIMRRVPHLTGTVFDLPHVIEDAKKNTSYNDLQDRISFEGGSFFESIPAGRDVYFAKSIIHDWDDEKSTLILKAICKAMPSHAKLLIVDQVIVENGSAFQMFADLHMMVMLNARERNEKQWRQLFASAGLKITRLTPLGGANYWVIEGEKATEYTK